MNEYITKLEEENKKLQETNSLYQERYGDIYETIENEKPRIIDFDIDSTSQAISGSLSSSFGPLTMNNIAQYGGGNVVPNVFTIQSSNMSIWQPQEDTKKLQKEISDLKKFIINQRKPFYKRKFRLIMRKIKRIFK